jgi:hypothetical protein
VFSSLNITRSYDACEELFNAIRYLLLILDCQYRGFNSSVATFVLIVELNLGLRCTELGMLIRTSSNWIHLNQSCISFLMI